MLCAACRSLGRTDAVMPAPQGVTWLQKMITAHDNPENDWAKKAIRDFTEALLESGCVRYVSGDRVVQRHEIGGKIRYFNYNGLWGGKGIVRALADGRLRRQVCDKYHDCYVDFDMLRHWMAIKGTRNVMMASQTMEGYDNKSPYGPTFGFGMLPLDVKRKIVRHVNPEAVRP
jgi:hypothetical protein